MAKFIHTNFRVLIALEDGEKTLEQLCYELDSPKPTVYGGVRWGLDCSYIHIVSEKGDSKSYALTQIGRDFITEKFKEAPERGDIQPLVFAAIRSGNSTYNDIMQATGLTYPQVASAIAKLTRKGKITRYDFGGPGTRGGGIRARFTECL